MDDRPRWIVALDGRRLDDALKTIANRAGLSRLSFSGDFPGCAVDEGAAEDGFVLQKLGIAVLRATPEQTEPLRACCDGQSGVLAVEAERIAYIAPPEPVPQGAPSREWLEWWPERTGVLRSHASGRHVRVAVLDTGIDREHPDFTHRDVVLPPGRVSHDGHGHGTSIAALACGNRVSAEGIQYGIAYEAELHVWKAVTDDGQLAEGGLKAGIEWALAEPQRCDLICITWAWPVDVGESYSPSWNAIGEKALARGALLIAAAGNRSERPDVVLPVSGPANCPSILAVGALGRNLDVWRTSNASLNPDGRVSVGGPGEDVYTATTRDRGRTHTLIPETSAAAGFVTGIAALHADLSGLRGNELRQLIESSAEPLPALAEMDVGKGLAIAP